MALKNIEALTNFELKEFFDSFDTVLISGSGTLWIQKKEINGAAESVQSLRKIGKRVILVTDNSSSGITGVLEKCDSLNFGFSSNDIVLPSLAIIHYFEKMEFDQELFVVGTPNLKQAFGNAGFTVANPGPETYKETCDELINNVSDNQNIGAVIFDFDLNFDYTTFLKALTYLARPEVRYITAGSYPKIPTGPNSYAMGQQAFQNMIKNVSCKPPIKFGKPSTNLSSYIEAKYGNNKSRTLYIGDSVENDMMFASRSRYEGVLVLNDLQTKEQAEADLNGRWPFDYYINNISDLTEIVKRFQKENNKSTLTSPFKF